MLPGAAGDGSGATSAANAGGEAEVAPGAGGDGAATSVSGGADQSGAGTSSGLPGGGGGSASAGTAGVGGSSGTGGAGAGTGGAGGGAAGTAGAGGSGTVDLMDGYWVLTASDSGGQNWTPSTLVFTNATSNPDGTVALEYRIDWFEDAGGSFGILLGGEEYGVGTYDPTAAHLVLDQTGGFASNPLDRYEADYDATSKDLVNGFWNTGNPGTFTGTHELSGHEVVPLVAAASSTRASLDASKAVDVDMMTNWSSANGATIGQTLTLTLPAPTDLEGFRLLSYPATNDAAPSRVLVHCFDSVGTEIATKDLSLPADPMWKPVPISVSSASSVALEVTEISPASGNRIVVQGVELFGRN
jgi:hypothetical protein